MLQPGRGQALDPDHRATVLSLIALLPMVATIAVAINDDSLRAALVAALPLLGRYALTCVLPAFIAWAAAKALGCKSALASFALFGMAIGFAVFAGVAQLSALALLLAASTVIGSLLLGSRLEQPAAVLVTSALAGLAVLVAVAGWSLPFRVHSSTSYLLVLGLIVFAGWSRLCSAVRIAARGWRDATQAQPLAAFFAVGIIGFAATVTWLPSLNPDDNSVHLSVARQLLADSYYRMDVSSQIFATAPWFNDVLHAVLSVVSGSESRSATGFLWLLFGCAGVFRLAQALGARGSFPWIAVALYASHPLTAYFGSTLQVDGASAACLLHIAACCVDLRRDADDAAPTVMIGVLCGAFAALKIINCVYLAMLGGWLIWHYLSTGRAARIVPLLLAAALVAGSSYFYAWLITGNPLFPLYNAVFRSAYMPPVNFGDGRWQTGMTLSTLWDITFSTGKFMEAYAGAAGLSLLACVGAWIVALRSGGWRAALIVVALVAASIIFYQVQYLRYIFPALVLLTTVAVVGVGSLRFRRVGAAVLVALIIVQCGLIRTTNWILASGPLEEVLARGPAALPDIERRFVPERALVRALESSGKEFCLLFADPETAYVALAPGKSLTTAFYDPGLSALASWADADASGERWRVALNRIGATHVELRPGQARPNLLKALSQEQFAVGSELGEAQIWSRPGASAAKCLTGMMAPRNEAKRLLSWQ